MLNKIGLRTPSCKTTHFTSNSDERQSFKFNDLFSIIEQFIKNH